MISSTMNVPNTSEVASGVKLFEAVPAACKVQLFVGCYENLPKEAYRVPNTTRPK